MINKTLFTELCMRLPYGVKLDYIGRTCTLKGIYIDLKKNARVIFQDGENTVDAPMDVCLPYLRSTSNLTEKEFYEYVRLCESNGITEENSRIAVGGELETFFCKKHLDFGDLLSKGLAIEVTDDNNPYKKNYGNKKPNKG